MWTCRGRAARHRAVAASAFHRRRCKRPLRLLLQQRMLLLVLQHAGALLVSRILLELAIRCAQRMDSVQSSDNNYDVSESYGSHLARARNCGMTGSLLPYSAGCQPRGSSHLYASAPGFPERAPLLPRECGSGRDWRTLFECRQIFVVSALSVAFAAPRSWFISTNMRWVRRAVCYLLQRLQLPIAGQALPQKRR